MKHRFTKVVGIVSAAMLASELMRRSKWFICEPWPDDVWLFEVKEEPPLPADYAWMSTPEQA